MCYWVVYSSCLYFRAYSLGICSERQFVLFMKSEAFCYSHTRDDCLTALCQTRRTLWDYWQAWAFPINRFTVRSEATSNTCHCQACTSACMWSCLHSPCLFCTGFSTFRALVRRGIRFYGHWNTEPSQRDRAWNYSRSVARSASDPRWGSLPSYFAAYTYAFKISYLYVRSFRSLLMPRNKI